MSWIHSYRNSSFYFFVKKWPTEEFESYQRYWSWRGSCGSNEERERDTDISSRHLPGGTSDDGWFPRVWYSHTTNNLFSHNKRIWHLPYNHDICFVGTLSDHKHTNWLTLFLFNVSAHKEMLDDDPFPSSTFMMSAFNHNDCCCGPLVS